MEFNFLSLNTPSIISLVGALIAAAGAFVSSQEQQKAQRQADAAQKEVVDKSAQIKDLVSEISAQSKANRLLTEEVAKLTLGGDSFAYVAFTHLSGDDVNFLYPVIIHQGKYPLYDLQVRIVDLNEFGKIKTKTLQNVQGQVIDLSNLNIGMCEIRNQKQYVINKTGHDFNIFFSARNGTWIQHTRFYLDGNNELKHSIKVTREVNGEKVEIFKKDQ